MVRRERVAVLEVNLEGNVDVELTLAAGKGRIIAGPASADGTAAAVRVVARRAVHEQQVVDDDISGFGIKGDDVVLVPLGFEIGLGLEFLVEFRRIAAFPVGAGEYS